MTPLLWTDDDVATALGMAKGTFQKRRKDYERDGFPKKDRLLNKYIRADVEAWIARRRQVKDVVLQTPEEEPNYDAA